jgi:hypothetical protein
MLARGYLKRASDAKNETQKHKEGSVGRKKILAHKRY